MKQGLDSCQPPAPGESNGYAYAFVLEKLNTDDILRDCVRGFSFFPDAKVSMSNSDQLILHATCKDTYANGYSYLGQDPQLGSNWIVFWKKVNYDDGVAAATCTPCESDTIEGGNPFEKNLSHYRYQDFCYPSSMPPAPTQSMQASNSLTPAPSISLQVVQV